MSARDQGIWHTRIEIDLSTVKISGSLLYIDCTVSSPGHDIEWHRLNDWVSFELFFLLDKVSRSVEKSENLLPHSFCSHDRCDYSLGRSAIRLHRHLPQSPQRQNANSTPSAGPVGQCEMSRHAPGHRGEFYGGPHRQRQQADGSRHHHGQRQAETPPKAGIHRGGCQAGQDPVRGVPHLLHLLVNINHVTLSFHFCNYRHPHSGHMYGHRVKCPLLITRHGRKMFGGLLVP